MEKIAMKKSRFTEEQVTYALRQAEGGTAAASVFVMDLDKATYNSQTQPMQSHINVGFGSDVTSNELAHTVAIATGYQGIIVLTPVSPIVHLES